jgi:hypothetical protein
MQQPFLPLESQAGSAPSANQRWRNGRAVYRRPDEPINPSLYEVAELAGDLDAKAFVLNHHYSGTYPAARFRYGLYRGALLVGVAVYSHPTNDRVLTSVFDCPPRNAVELGRFVLLDDVPGNGESWFLARTFELLRKVNIRGVVSFSDPVPRRSATGHIVMPGHVGTIYQAANGRYLGPATARRLYLLPNGQLLHPRTLQKIRSGERGWRYAAEQLQHVGASSPPHHPDERRSWLNTELHRIARTINHPGNHRYAWPLHRRCQVLLDSRPYPKLSTSFAAARANAHRV